MEKECTIHIHAKKLGEWLGINLVDIYKKVCEYVHFTLTSLFSTVAGTENNIVHFFFFFFFPKEKEEDYNRLATELANDFYYMGVVLIKDLFGSWMDGK